MEIKPGKLKGTYEIILSPNEDERGFFMRTYDSNIFEKAGINNTWVQENHSRSTRKGVIRGLHFQFPPYTETKLVRCIRGSVYDVFVDLRKGSETFGEWDSIELSEDNKRMIYIPRGFAHGFYTLSEMSEVLYKVDNYYNPEAEGGIIWNDPDLEITWATKSPIVSEKDSKLQTLKEFIENYDSLDLNKDYL